MNAIEWDTSLVLSVVFAPLAILFIGLWAAASQKTNRLQHEKESLVAEVVSLQQQATTTATQHRENLQITTRAQDAEIERQQQEIAGLREQVWRLEADVRTLTETLNDE